MVNDKIPAWCAGEEWCSITAASDIIGKKWHQVLISLVTKKEQGFNELNNDVQGISAKIFSENLDELQQKSLAKKKIVGEKPLRVKYSLTSMGKDLKPVLNDLDDWAVEHLEPSEKKRSVI